MKPSIKKIALTRLLQVYIVSIFIIIAVVALSYRSFFKLTIEDKSHAIAEIVKAGLTSHMKAGLMSKRSYYLDEISSAHEIESIKVLRSEAVEKQYGKPNSYEKRLDSDLYTRLLTGEPLYFWEDTKNRVDITVPYIAESTGKLNCLQCHNVKEGELLGAIEMSINIGRYQKVALKYSYIIAAIMSFFAIATALNMFRVIERFIRKPLSKVVKEGKTAYISHVGISSEQYESRELKALADNINDYNADILEKEAHLEEKNRQLIALNEEIELTLREIMMAMGEMEEIRSADTKNHTQRVSKLSALIAKEYGLEDKQVYLIEMGSALHDIGKVGIPDSILLKPGALSNEEFDRMKLHTTMGFNVLRHSERMMLKVAAQIAHSHHEKYDGTGYPQGLKGDEIPIYARIVAIVDVLDALLSKRVYKEAWSVEKVRAFLIDSKDKHFEPKLVEIVVKNLPKYAKLIEELS